jgi:hypothetical protein
MHYKGGHWCDLRRPRGSTHLTSQDYAFLHDPAELACLWELNNRPDVVAKVDVRRRLRALSGKVGQMGCTGLGVENLVGQPGVLMLAFAVPVALSSVVPNRPWSLPTSSGRRIRSRMELRPTRTGVSKTHP